MHRFLTALTVGVHALLSVCSPLSGQEVFYVEGFAVDSMQEASGPFSEHLSLELDPSTNFRLNTPEETQSAIQTVVGRDVRHGAVEGLLNRAEGYVKAGEVDSAFTLLEQAVSLAPQRGDLQARAALYASMAGFYEKAATFFEGALLKLPRNQQVLTGYVSVLIRLGRFDEAFENQRFLDERTDENLMNRYNWACLEALGLAEDESGDWRMLMFNDTYRLLTWLHQDLPEFKKTWKDEQLQNLVQRTTGLPTIGLVGQGLSLMRAFMQEDPDTVPWMIYYQGLKNFLDQGAFSIGCWMEYARYAFYAGYSEEAVKIMAAIQTQYPDSIEVKYSYAYLLMQVGAYREATILLEGINQSTPEFLESQFALASAYAGLGDMDRAWPILESILEKNPTALPELIAGEKDYLQAIRSDARYTEFSQRLKSRLR